MYLASRRTRAVKISLLSAAAVMMWSASAAAVQYSPKTTGGTADTHSARLTASGYRCVSHTWGWPGHSAPAADAQLCVGDAHKKRIYVADNKRDGRGLGIEIDPSGPAGPLVYYDRDESGNHTYAHLIGYSVRKWRFVSVRTSTGRIDGVLPWRVSPLPHPDY